MTIEVLCGKCRYVLYRLTLNPSKRPLRLDRCPNCNAKLAKEILDIEVERLDV
jgi:uncharacterized protein with PIN domain